MAVATQEQKLEGIADAIRKKEGSTGKIVADDFEERILQLPEPEIVFDWTQNTFPSSSIRYSVTYGGGKFVAVSSSGKFDYSEDGVVWTSSTMPMSYTFKSITYGNGKFVAISSNSTNAAYSEDGVSWYASTLPSSSTWYSVTYGNGKFVAVASDSGKSAYSTDGITWVESTMPFSGKWRSVTYGDGKFVAIVYNSALSAYSTDGISWTESTMPLTSLWNSVTYGGGKFVAVANSTNSAYSEDGINWTASILPSSAVWVSITYGSGKFVAVANNTSSAYSKDGITWSASNLPFSQWNGVTYGDGKFVAVSSNAVKYAYAIFKPLDTSDATATSSDILTGKTAYAKGSKITGTIAEKEAADVTVNGETVTTPAGYYKNQVSKSVTTVTHPAPTQALTLGTYATIRASHQQAAGYVSAGTTTADYNITRNAGGTKTPGTSNQTLLSSGLVYLNNPLVMSGSSNLVSSNIRSGVNIFGITGSYSGNTPSTYAVTISTNGSEVHVRYTGVNCQESSVSIGSTYGSYSTTIYPLAGSYGTIRTSNKSIQIFDSAPFFSNDYLPAQYYIVYMGIFSGPGSMTVN